MGILLLIRDELIGWLKTLDKPGREGDRQFYLEAWSGDSSFTADRIGRGTIHIPANRVSVIGTATPGALREYVRNAMTDGAGADGLMQRLQMLVWPDALPPFANVDREPNEEARNRTCAVFETLDALEPSRIGAVTSLDGSLPHFRFDDGGQDVFDGWRESIEERLRGELADLTALEAHVAKYRSLFPSLALVFHLIDGAANGTTERHVGEQHARLAGDWCQFLEAHARKLYADGGALGAAGCLAERIEEGEVKSGDTLRAIYRRGWAGLSSLNRLEAAARILEEANWLAVERATAHGPGRPGSPRIVLHPHFAARGQR
jgi:hypothetical protein